jgi:hypothetical protein
MSKASLGHSTELSEVDQAHRWVENPLGCIHNVPVLKMLIKVWWNIRNNSVA